MITRLTIKNYALIKYLVVNPSGQLNIITGETGAGKSILLGALGLLLGNRADTKTLLNSDNKCIIEAEFDIRPYKLKTLFQDWDLDYEDLTIFRREISPAGKSRAFINDTPTTIETLKLIGSLLVDVHSQHDTLLLGESGFQLGIVDAFAENSHLLKDYQRSFSEYRSTQRELSELKERQANLEKEREFNQFQFDELEKAELSEGEEEALEKELDLLSNAGDIKEKLSLSIENLSGDDLSILTAFSEIKARLNSIRHISKEIGELSERADSLYIEIKELVRDLETEDTDIEVNPGRIEEVQERLGVIHNLKQKHRKGSEAELIELKNELSSSLMDTVNLEQKIEKLERDFETLKGEVDEKALALRQSRVDVFPDLEGEIMEILHQLAIPHGVLRAEYDEIAPGPMGTEKINFKFSANKGVEPQEMKRVASGGEFSRLMFAIKYVVASRKSMPTLIFDEIDSGISGEVAFTMGRMMKEIGKNQQVIAITHLPQIASIGQKHYFVFKESGTDSTTTQIREIDGQERITEIAKMMAGENPSETAFQNARELIDKEE